MLKELPVSKTVDFSREQDKPKDTTTHTSQHGKRPKQQQLKPFSQLNDFLRAQNVYSTETLVECHKASAQG